MLADALAASDALGGTTWYPEFQGALAEALAGQGRLTDALATIELALAKMEAEGERWCMPELLRLKGEILGHPPASRSASLAEDCFAQALEAAREQGALSWELRAAMSLARLRVTQNRAAEARRLLASVYAQFSEGFATGDLRAAHAMLAGLAATRK